MKILSKALAAILVVVPGVAMADVTVGTPTGGNCFPFGCPQGTQYQQVYAASDFSGPLTIGGIQFKKNQGASAVNSGTFSFSLSTTSAAVDALSSTFASNLGADNTLLFSGSIVPSFDGTFLTVMFGSSFSYNPLGGNLLLDITTVGQSGNAIYFDSMSGDAGGLFSRMHDYGSGFSGFGLVTTFITTSAVPEPASWAMMIGGFAVIGAAMRRRATAISFA